MPENSPRAAGEILLVHSSDVHVDEPILPGDDGLAGLRRVLATAASLDADLVLLAGDTFDNARVSAPVLRRARDLFAAAGRRVVLLPGNHDPLLENHLFQRAGLVDIAHLRVLGLAGDDSVLFEDLDLEIVGLAHRGYSDFRPLPLARPRGARWQVIMAHGHYVPPGEAVAQAHRAWRFDDAALAAAGGDYIALGHWDRPLRVGTGGVAAYYSGAPDLAGTLNMIHLDPAHGVTVTREPLVRGKSDPQ